MATGVPEVGDIGGYSRGGRGKYGNVGGDNRYGATVPVPLEEGVVVDIGGLWGVTSEGKYHVGGGGSDPQGGRGLPRH